MSMRPYEPGSSCCRAPSTTATPDCAWPALWWRSPPAGSMKSDGGSTRLPAHPPVARFTTGSAPASPRRTASAPCTPGCSATSEPAERPVRPPLLGADGAVALGRCHLHLARCLPVLARTRRGGSGRTAGGCDRCRAASFRPAMDRLPQPAQSHPPPAGRP